MSMNDAADLGDFRVPLLLLHSHKMAAERELRAIEKAAKYSQRADLQTRKSLPPTSQPTGKLQGLAIAAAVQESDTGLMRCSEELEQFQSRPSSVDAQVRRARKDTLIASVAGQLHSPSLTLAAPTTATPSQLHARPPATLAEFFDQPFPSCANIAATAAANSKRQTCLPDAAAARSSPAVHEGGLLAHFAIHIFVDNSNVLHGFQRHTSDLLRLPREVLHMNYHRLFHIIEDTAVTTIDQHLGPSQHYPVLKKVLVASKPLAQDCISESRHHGYETHLLERIKKQSLGPLAGRPTPPWKNKGNKEMFVDELLHGKISESLLDYDRGCLCLVSGDGNWSEYGTGFSHQIARALRREWIVIVYSFSNQLSTVFEHFRRERNFHICLLDDAALSLTELKQ
ncbi:hypothetical protein RI367_000024 [Sorochytrium milnesiophthora]